MNELKEFINWLKTAKKNVLLVFSVVVFLIFNELLVLWVTYILYQNYTVFPIEQNMFINSLSIFLGPIYYFIVIFIDSFPPFRYLMGLNVIIPFIPVLLCLVYIAVIFSKYKKMLIQNRNKAFKFLLMNMMIWIFLGTLMYILILFIYPGIMRL
ncbi:MAG: hypothetical protein CVV21_01920 [Candidatus Goldiibacteriota bacterium HGW-Goldbacteria-1]|nr:MAG: hypothetical protein CVV21_01920 [Candidatus Goldiibacteriota bacterium HGW-Goldbacteria-1]